MKTKIQILIFALIICFSNNKTTFAQCHIDDWNALKSLHESTDGINWINRTGWNDIIFGHNSPPANCDLSLLYGVTLTNSRVTCIDLDGEPDCEETDFGGNNLVGNIPEGLLDLEHIEILNLSNNFLEGVIPIELSYLNNLKVLDLGHNRLTGIIPIELASLNNLTELHLGNNSLNGNIPMELVTNLNNLRRLYLGHNMLTGAIPSEIGNLTYLTELQLGNNSLSGIIPLELVTNLNNLRKLYLGHNMLTGAIPSEIGNLTYLTELHLGNNSLSGIIPLELVSNLNNLMELLLGDNMLTGAIPPETGNLTKLEILRLSNNQLSGSIPKEIENLNSLRSLYLFDNQLSGSIPSEIGNLSNLSELILSLNLLTGFIPSELTNLDSLTWLKIDNNNLSGCYPSNISQLCTQLAHPSFNSTWDISPGNNFYSSWEDFCTKGEGACSPYCACTDLAACNYNPDATCDDGGCQYICAAIPVYPGDLNHDGYVDNIDFVLKDDYLYNSGIARASEHQNTDWYAHPSEDWGVPQFNGKDIKHHDCNGDGIIDESDYEAIDENWEMEWTGGEDPPPPPTESAYQIRFYPIEDLNPGYLRMNIALENVTGGDLVLDRAYFTLRYNDLAENITLATFNFTTFPWIGVQNIDFESTVEHYPSDKEIKVGFKRTDGANSVGSGIIGELTLLLDETNNARSNANPCIINFEAVKMGTINNASQQTLLKNQQLQVNLCEGTCETNWYINETQFQNEFKSTNLIETDGYLIIGEEQQVNYQSNRVCLRPGFRVKAGASFKAGYGSCN